MSEEMANKVLQQANRALEDNEKVIANLPSYQAYYCRGEDEIRDLIDYMDSYINSIYPVMSGTEEKTREMLLEYIEIAEKEIEAAKGILIMLGWWKGGERE